MPFQSTPSRTEPALACTLRILAIVAIAAGASVLTTPRDAFAQPNEKDRQARTHYESGVKRFDAGDYEGAYREFEIGHQVSGRPKFLLSMAHAQRRRGELHDAVRLYQKYLSLVSDSPLQTQVKHELRRLEASLDEQRRRQLPKRAGGLSVATAAQESRQAATESANNTIDADRPMAPSLAVHNVAAGPRLMLEPPPPAALAKTVIAEEKRAGVVTGIADESRGASADKAASPYYRRPWFWVAIAAGVVATGAVAATQLPRTSDNGRSQVIGTLGSPVE